MPQPAARIAPPPPLPGVPPTLSAPSPSAPSIAPSGAAAPLLAAPAEAVGGIALIPVIAATAAILTGDLFFPQSTAKAEAPGIDPAISPSNATPKTLPPITSPANGLYDNSSYLITLTIFRKNVSETPNPSYSYQSAFGATGANVPFSLTSYFNTYPFKGGGYTEYITGVVITLNGAVSGALRTPSLQPLATPQQPTQPLQDPVAVDSEGNRRVFTPTPTPEKLPRVQPQILPQKSPIAPPSPTRTVPPEIVPPVVPIAPPNAPPFVPPFPFPNTPPYPYPLPPFEPRRRDEKDPISPVRPPFPGVTVTPVTVTPSIGDPLFPPTEGDGKLKVPLKPTIAPPFVPPSRRQRGADCCEETGGSSEKCDLTEVLKKIKELHDCVCLEGREIASKSLGYGDSGSYSLPVDTIAVFVEVTQIGSQVRRQSGNANGQTILYIGSYAFGIGSGYSDRNPISFEHNGFFAPERAEKFEFQLNFGSIAQVTAMYLKPRS